MKKIFSLIIGLFLTCSVASASFQEHYDLAQQYLSQYQYSSAIIEFKKALRINYLDNSARIGLVNSYLARGTYSANKERNWESAANDYRAALFYLKYYASAQEVQNSSQAISNTTGNINQCLALQKISTTPQSRYQIAKNLRLQGLFAEAGYEFAQSAADNSLRAKSLEQLADIMKTLGNDPKAVEYYQKAVALAQDNAELRLKYARILDKMGQNDIAVQEYNYALSKCDNDPETFYSLERIYRQKLEQAPNDAEVIANLGAILQKEGKLDEALRYYMQAGQLNPSNVTTRLNVGTLYQQKKSYDAAIQAYDSILVLYPDNVNANFYRAQCLAELGKNDQAISAFKTVLNMDPTNKQAKSELFDLLKTTMTPSEMLSYMQKESALGGNTADSMYDYALDLHKQNKFDDAIACYKEILKVKSDNPEIYVNLAIAYNQKKDLANAIATLQAAKVKFPNNKQVLDNLKAFSQDVALAKLDEASSYYNSNDYQKALVSYQSIQPQTFDSLVGMAAAYKGLNNDALAIESYKKALAISPTNSDIAYYIGALYYEKEDLAQSKIYLKKALALDKNNAKANELYQTVVEQANIKIVDGAITLYDKGEYVPAMKIFTQVLLEDPKNSYALYYRGLIYDVDKKYALAIVDYKKAIQYNSELSIVYYLMGLDYDNLTQSKNALINYKKYVSLTTETNEYKTYAQARAKELVKYEK